LQQKLRETVRELSVGGLVGGIEVARAERVAGVGAADEVELGQAAGRDSERLGVSGGVGESERVSERGEAGWDEPVGAHVEETGKATWEDDQREADEE
jgi:hypothetical protein